MTDVISAYNVIEIEFLLCNMHHTVFYYLLQSSDLIAFMWFLKSLMRRYRYCEVSLIYILQIFPTSSCVVSIAVILLKRLCNGHKVWAQNRFQYILCLPSYAIINLPYLGNIMLYAYQKSPQTKGSFHA